MYAIFVKTMLAVLFMVAIGISSWKPVWVPLRGDLTLQSVVGALGGLFVIVLLVERLTEIVIAVWRRPKAEVMKTEIKQMAKDSSKETEKFQKQRSLTEYQTETKSLALWIGYGISVLVCCSGVGVLDSLLQISAGNTIFLRGVDIVLTAALIAGGSDGFHQFMAALESFFKETKDRIQTPS